MSFGLRHDATRGGRLRRRTGGISTESLAAKMRLPIEGVDEWRACHVCRVRNAGRCTWRVVQRKRGGQAGDRSTRERLTFWGNGRTNRLSD